MNTSQNAACVAAWAEPCPKSASMSQAWAVEKAMKHALNTMVAHLRKASIQHLLVGEWEDIDTHADNALELAIDQLKRTRNADLIDSDSFFEHWDRAASTITLIAQAYSEKHSQFRLALQSAVMLFSVQSDAVERATREGTE